MYADSTIADEWTELRCAKSRAVYVYRQLFSGSGAALVIQIISVIGSRP